MLRYVGSLEEPLGNSGKHVLTVVLRSFAPNRRFRATVMDRQCSTGQCLCDKRVEAATWQSTTVRPSYSPNFGDGGAVRENTVPALAIYPRVDGGSAMLTIHHLGHSQSERIVWLCEELGVPYKLMLHERDPVTILSPPALKALHPLGTAPLIQDDGLLLGESAAIRKSAPSRGSQPVVKTRSQCDIRRRDRGHRQADPPSAHNRRRLTGPAVTMIWR